MDRVQMSSNAHVPYTESDASSSGMATAGSVQGTPGSTPRAAGGERLYRAEPEAEPDAESNH